MQAPLGNFAEAWRAIDRPDLVGPPVLQALSVWSEGEEVLVVDTDPELADTANFCAAYDVSAEASANCVVVAAKRKGSGSSPAPSGGSMSVPGDGQTVTLAACVVLASTRADVNGLVRKHLDARKASFASTDTAVELTGMEYGGITPIGLPTDWPVLVDAAVASTPYVIIGSGRRRGKLIVAGKVLSAYPHAQTLAGLGI